MGNHQTNCKQPFLTDYVSLAHSASSTRNITQNQTIGHINANHSRTTRILQFSTHSPAHRFQLVTKLKQKQKLNQQCPYIVQIQSIQEMAPSTNLCSSVSKIYVYIERPNITLYRYMKLQRRKKTYIPEQQLLSVIYCGCQALSFVLSNGSNPSKQINFGLTEMYLTQQGLIKMEDPQLWRYEHCFQAEKQSPVGLQTNFFSHMKNFTALILSLVYLREVTPQQLAAELIEGIIQEGYSNTIKSLLDYIYKSQSQDSKQQIENIKNHVVNIINGSSSQCESKQKKKKLTVTLAKVQSQTLINCLNLSCDSLFEDESNVSDSSNEKIIQSLMGINLDTNGNFTFNQQRVNQISQRSSKVQANGHLRPLPKDIFNRRMSFNKNSTFKNDLNDKMNEQNLNDKMNEQNVPSDQALRSDINSIENLELSNKFERLITAKKSVTSQHLTRQTSNADYRSFSHWQASSHKKQNSNLKHEIFQLSPEHLPRRDLGTIITTEMEICELQGQRSYILELMDEGLTKSQQGQQAKIDIFLQRIL